MRRTEPAEEVGELAGEPEHRRVGSGDVRAPYDVFWAAPESRAVWAALAEPVLRAVARCDAERSRVASALRDRITAPVYSVADRFASWERVVRRVEPGRPGEDLYPISAYGNDLRSRDALEELMRALPVAAAAGAPGRLPARLDVRFDAAGVPDPERSLRPWIRPANEEPGAELGAWWTRKPVRAPWDG